MISAGLIKQIENGGVLVNNTSSGALAGSIWFIGWLFTIGFAKLIWWKALLAIVIWAYYLGVAAIG
jgi:hypothetical protein